MAATIPPALKGADVQRFAHRAQQLEQVRPIISYWCEYYILQKILATGLHTTDDACQTYAIHLMDKLESTKASNTSNDAILDDVAAKAYVENFALETFARADESQRSNRVTRQTADTFQAALTFLELLGIWGEVDQEVKAKSRFAKYHAVRIAKAIKNGEDPNATNPVVEEPKAPALGDGEEDVIEAELRDMEHGGSVATVASGGNGVYKAPTVESAEDSNLPSQPRSPQNKALSPPPTLPSRVIEPDVSPIDDPAESDISNVRQGSIGGGYFPSVPDAPASKSSTTAPEDEETSTTTDYPPSSTTTSAFATPGATQSSHIDFYNPTAPAAVVSPPPTSAPDTPLIPQGPLAPVTQARAQPPPPQPKAQPIQHEGPPAGGYNTDDDSVLAAQKHAKWAISALNFEDVGTAVRELRFALSKLGAT